LMAAREVLRRALQPLRLDPSQRRSSRLIPILSGIQQKEFHRLPPAE
jgi:hypothetical protein